MSNPENEKKIQYFYTINHTNKSQNQIQNTQGM